MSKRETYSYELKLATVQNCNSGKMTTYEASIQSGVSRRRIREWISLYRSMGESGLTGNGNHAGYPEIIKISAVEDYLTGKYSQLEICEKYQIRSTISLRRWISMYNGHEQLTLSGTGGGIMIKGRSTTFEERVEIVKECIETRHNYNETALKHGVSYQQVRNWTIKYEQSGVDALQDRRGKRKSENKMTELEKLKAENILLIAKSHRLALENEYLKKLKSLERGW